MKFIQAHQIAKNTMKYPTRAEAVWPSSTPWPRAAAACETATTKVRSNSSSSGVETRSGSSCARATIGRRQREVAPGGGGGRVAGALTRAPYGRPPRERAAR